MAAMRVVTPILVLTLTGSSLGYGYRGQWARGRRGGLGDYMGGYGEEQYALPDYGGPRYTFANPARPTINQEAVAALLSAALDDYIQDYATYNDDEGTWYDDLATDNANNNAPTQQDTAFLRLLLSPQQPPVQPSAVHNRYSLEDLEKMERKEEMEDNTENQLHELAQPQKKSSGMPVLGGRMAVSPVLLGQKEEAYDIPATSVRRPVFARTILTEDDQSASREPSKKSSSTQQHEEHKEAQEQQQTAAASIQDSTTASSTTTTSTTSSSSSSSSSSKVAPATGISIKTPMVQERYNSFKNFLAKERKARQQQDEKDEREWELRAQRRLLKKRFIPEKEALTQQLASLKKTVA